MGEAGAVGGHEVRGRGAGLEDFVVEEDAVVGCRARVCDVHARFGVAGGVHFFDFVHRWLAPEGRGCVWAGCLQGFPGPELVVSACSPGRVDGGGSSLTDHVAVVVSLGAPVACSMKVVHEAPSRSTEVYALLRKHCHEQGPRRQTGSGAFCVQNRGRTSF